MPNFPVEKINDICRQCGIPRSHWQFLSGTTSQGRSTGAAVRLRLLQDDARRDVANRLSPERVQCFLAAISQETWYPAWREWLVGNSQHPVLEDRLPGAEKSPAPAQSGRTGGPCKQPTRAEFMANLRALAGTGGKASYDEIRGRIEETADRQGDRLCPGWWEKLISELES